MTELDMLSTGLKKIDAALGADAMETSAQYHADHTHLGSTMIRTYRESPAKYRDLYVTKVQKPEPASNEMVLGSLTHCLVSGLSLEGEFLVAEGCKSRQGNAWKDVAEQAAESDLTPVLPAQVETAGAMAEAVRRHELAGQLFGAVGPTEEPIRWRHRTRLCLKCRPDKLILGGPPTICIDLKTSATPAPAQFLWVAWHKYAYHVQAALYLQGVQTVAPGPCDFVWAVVGNKPPHDVWCYRLGPKTRELAEQDLEETLDRLQHSLAYGDWDAPHQNELNPFDPPRGVLSAEEVTLLIDGEEVSV